MTTALPSELSALSGHSAVFILPAPAAATFLYLHRRSCLNVTWYDRGALDITEGGFSLSWRIWNCDARGAGAAVSYHQRATATWLASRRIYRQHIVATGLTYRVRQALSWFL